MADQDATAERVASQARALRDELVAIRRDIHRHPELGMEEVRTAGIAADYLEKLGIEVQRAVGGTTAVVGLLRGARPGKTVALRADMDALPIKDQKDVDYKSTVDGKMHACGHDGHTAMLMGTAKVLAGLRGELSGNVKFLFQPAEEGPGGAEPMVKAGVMRGVDGVFGAHLFSDLPVGQIGVRSGPASAAASSFQLKIKGHGGHAAHPNQGVDAIALTGQVITALQTIVSRETDPVEPAVLTIGTINGGYRRNVICDEVTMTGTIRTLDPALHERVPRRMEAIVKGITESMRGGYELQVRFGYPSVVNAPEMAEICSGAATAVVGAGNVIIVPPTMGAEDFSYFAREVPGMFFRVGGNNAAKGLIYPGHHSKYDFDEDALPIGVAVMALSALEFLAQ